MSTCAHSAALLRGTTAPWSGQRKELAGSLLLQPSALPADLTVGGGNSSAGKDEEPDDDGELEFTIKGPALIILVLIPFLGRFVLDYVHGQIKRLCSGKTADGGFPLPAGKKYHFFICHHQVRVLFPKRIPSSLQGPPFAASMSRCDFDSGAPCLQGSGGDQANLLFVNLKDLGFKVWYDNGQNADHRNLQGMKQGVRESVCLLIFLSGRKETNGQADLGGEYEGPFTRWFCQEEMATAHEHDLDFVGDHHIIQWGPHKLTRKEIPAVYTSNGTHPAGSMWARGPIPACAHANGGYVWRGTSAIDCEPYPWRPENLRKTQFPPPLGHGTWCQLGFPNAVLPACVFTGTISTWAPPAPPGTSPSPDPK